MTNDKLIEAMRQAVYDAIEVGEDAENIARAALAAAESAGYRLVPVEPTDAMVDSVLQIEDQASRRGETAALPDIWAAMLAAAPDHSEQDLKMVESGWIDANKSQPAPGQVVVGLVWGQEVEPTIVQFDGLHWGDAGDEYAIGHNVTHWMPLPAAPEVGRD